MSNPAVYHPKELDGGGVCQEWTRRTMSRRTTSKKSNVKKVLFVMTIGINGVDSLSYIFGGNKSDSS